MGDFLTTPQTFSAAKDFLAQKVDLPTRLGSLDIAQKVPAKIRAQSFFSAKVSSANILQALRTQVESIARGDYNYAEGRLRLKEFLAKQGYGVPDVGAKGEKDLTNLASTRRLNLILEQNVAMAHAVGQREVAENPAVMELFPCYEYRTGPNPRDEHAALDGLVLHKKDPFWQTHYPPWEFNCNCDVVDSEEQPNGQSSGFAKHSPMSGTLEYKGKSLVHSANPSGFEFDSTPQTVFGKPDFATVKDPGLREQITAAFNEKFSAFGLAAMKKPAAAVGPVTTPGAPGSPESTIQQGVQSPGEQVPPPAPPHVVFGSADHPITVEQRQAIHDWSSPAFKPMMKALQDEFYGRQPDADAMRKVNALRTALAILPPFEGTTWRGWSFSSKAELEVAIAAYQVGHVVQWPFFSASSSKLDVAERYAAQKPFGVVLEVRGKSGRDIAAFAKKKHEHEVLFPEKGWFRVDSVSPGRIVLAEI